MGAPGVDKNSNENDIPSGKMAVTSSPCKNSDNSGLSETPKAKKNENHNYAARPRVGRKGQGVRTKRRIENTNFLLSLVENEEYGELSMSDFASSEPTCFEQLFMNEESMQIWNDFINQTGEEQERFLDNLDQHGAEMEKTDDEKENPHKDDDFEELVIGPEDGDQRKEHPAYSAKECFKRVSRKIRSVLRRRNFPKRSLEIHEEELVPWFKEDPNSIWISQLPNSFERLLLHAVSQYLDLRSLSYDCKGKRQTKVENNHPSFNPPAMLLSQYLDSLS